MIDKLKQLLSDFAAIMGYSGEQDADVLSEQDKERILAYGV